MSNIQGFKDIHGNIYEFVEPEKEVEVYNGSGFTVNKLGKLCILTINKTYTNTSGWNTIGTLPTGFRPIIDTNTLLYENATTDISKALLEARILTDGTFKVYFFSSIGTGTKQIMGEIIYFTE